MDRPRVGGPCRFGGRVTEEPSLRRGFLRVQAQVELFDLLAPARFFGRLRGCGPNGLVGSDFGSGCALLLW